MVKALKIFFSLLLFPGVYQSNGQEIEFFKKDYNEHFIVKEKSGDFIPLLGDQKNHQVLHFYINPKNNSSNLFEICTDDFITVLVDNSIRDQLRENECRLIPIDSLLALNSSSDSVLLTIYKDKTSEVRTSLLHRALNYAPPTITAKTRDQDNEADSFLIFIFVIFIAIILLREINPKFSEEFASIQKTVSLRVRQSTLYKSKFYSREVTLILVIQSMILATIYEVLTISYPELSLKLFDSHGFWVEFSEWLIMASVFYVFAIAHLSILWLVNLFFRQKECLPIQFIDSLRLNNINFLFIFLILFGSFIISPNLFKSVISTVWIGFAIFYAIKLFIIYFKLSGVTSFRKIHLFSYFCATEILPALLVVKIVFL
ncbi:MAG: DUF4271 domain-containing protein [Cyclobacteriaceae bacterium]